MKTGLTIVEMATEVMRQNNAKADYIVDTRRLEMEAFGSGITLKMLDDSRNDVVEPLDMR